MIGISDDLHFLISLKSVTMLFVSETPIKRRSVPSQRLQKSIAEKLTAADIDLRKRYYKRKMEMLKRIAVAQECIASAKEQESSAIERIAVAVEAYLKH